MERIERPHLYLAVDEPERATLPPSPIEDLAFSLNQPSIPLTGEKDTRWLVRHWERARIEVRRSERRFVLVLDKIQKIPN